jgi:hypothetical protein
MYSRHLCQHRVFTHRQLSKAWICPLTRLITHCEMAKQLIEHELKHGARVSIEAPGNAVAPKRGPSRWPTVVWRCPRECIPGLPTPQSTATLEVAPQAARLRRSDCTPCGMNLLQGCRRQWPTRAMFLSKFAAHADGGISNVEGVLQSHSRANEGSQEAAWK